MIRLSMRWALFPFLAATAHAQVVWSTMTPPPGGGGVFCYDSWRDRLAGVTASLTVEFDGTSWATWPTPHAGVSWMAFDESRGRAVLSSGLLTADIREWDGVAWTTVGATTPEIGGSSQAIYHRGLGKIVVGVQSGVQSFELYAWDGTSFSLLAPGAVTPPLRPPFSNNTYSYGIMAYDEVRDCIVMFGRWEQGPVGLVSRTPITWEWHAGAGWVNVGTSGTMMLISTIWFDRQRNTIVRFDEGNGSLRSAYLRQPNGSWSPLGVQGTPRLRSTGAHDWRRNRFYIWDIPTSQMGFVGDEFPARYDAHGTGCQAVAQPSLDLTEPSTRAWIGGTLSVDIGNLIAPFAILSMGFDDQSYHGSPLPLSLGSFGMPQCFLSMAPAASVLAAATNGRATVSLQIPNASHIVGVNFYQQAFASVAGANARGVLASHSTVGVVGQSQ